MSNLEWTHETDDGGRGYWTAPSRQHDDGVPFHWQIDQIGDLFIIAGSDGELLDASDQDRRFLCVESAQRHCQLKERIINGEMPKAPEAIGQRPACHGEAYPRRREAREETSLGEAPRGAPHGVTTKPEAAGGDLLTARLHRLLILATGLAVAEGRISTSLLKSTLTLADGMAVVGIAETILKDRMSGPVPSIDVAAELARQDRADADGE